MKRWVFTLFLWAGALTAAPPLAKHRRGEGLMPVKPTPQSQSAKAPAKPATGKKTPPAAPAQTRRSTPSGDSAGAHASKHGKSKPCVPMALEKLFALPEPSSPQVATQGAYFLAGATSRRQVYRQTTADEQPVALTPDHSVALFQVSPQKDSFVAVTDSGELLLWRNQKLETLVPFSEAATISAVKWDPKGTKLFLTAKVGTSDSDQLFELDPAAGVSRGLSALRIGRNRILDVSPNGRRLALVNISKNGAEITVWEQNGKTVVIPKPVPASTSAFFTADSSGLFFLGLAGGKTVLFFTTLPKLSVKPVSSERGSIDFLSLDSARHQLVYTVNHEGASKFGGWEIAGNGSTKRRHVLPITYGVVRDPAAVVESAAGENQRFFFVRSTPTRPDQLWLWKGTAEELWTPLPDAEQSEGCWAQPEPVAVSPSTGMLFLPPGAKLPVPFVVYSDPHDARPRFNPAIPYFGLRGFGVWVSPEQEGFGPLSRWLVDKGMSRKNEVFGFGGPLTLSALREAVASYEAKLKTLEKEKGPR